ncbi:MAG TPA: phospholipid carrier-dependent glycosyltransferase [Candidatus Limnocylindria bacterium]|nr:phospholipid carrier-dependent glycosyltransferase [Candidatus Limnocylindria bacterium]
MTAPQAERAPSADGAAPALVTLLLAGLLLRLTIAYVLLPGSGFESDIGTFTAWALRMAEVGPGGFYAPDVFADYPPAYLYVLWLLGGTAHLLSDLTGTAPASIAAGLIKLPPMLADVGIGLLLYLLVRSWLLARLDRHRLGLLAAAIYLFNPVTWYDSAIWGQTDAVGALVLLLGVAALIRGNSEGAVALAVLAGLVKPQFGVVLVPLVGVVLLRRHLFAPGSGPRHRPRVPQAVRGWFEEERGPWRLLSSGVVGMLLLLAFITPFGLDVISFARRMAETAGGYEYLTVNAYNLWALVGAGGRPPFAFGGGWSPDTVPLLGPLPGVVIGGALLLGGFLLGLLRAAWRDDARSIVMVAVFLALAFFALPTRVHERYLFPVFALLPLLAVIDRRWLWATVLLSLASFINLHGVLTNPLYATPDLENLPLGAAFREPLAIVASAVLHSGVFLFVLWRLRRSAAEEEDAAGEYPAAVGAGEGWQGPAAAGAGGLALAASLGRLAHRLTDVLPLRRDRSASLVGETGGRLGRLDVLLLVLVFLSTLGLRTLRLDEPYSMHFDEVYHARTGIEFLQHWRYDMPHSIYEYTHPHLAKYAMAGGIVLLGNNRVTAQADLGVAARSAALERRWSPAEAPDERDGDRLYLATGTQLVVYDLHDLSEVSRVPLAATQLVLDESRHLLYAGDASGSLWRINTLELDLLRHAGPAAGPPTLEELAGPGELEGQLSAMTVVHGQLLLISDSGELVAYDPDGGSETGRASVPGAVGAAAVTTQDGEAVVVGGDEGLTVLEAGSLAEQSVHPTAQPVSGVALVTEGTERPTVYATTGSTLQTLEVPGDEAPRLGGRLEMPGLVSEVLPNPATALVHVLGLAPDSAPTVYVVEPRSFAVFADARLPAEPVAAVLDTQPERPAHDRAELLALSADGELARVDVGSNAFAWRFPGVLAGSLLAVAIYLLARFLFERRSVAVIASLLVLADGMFLANARIAMNDTYVTLFIVAAVALFAPLWLRRWRSRAQVFLGLAGVGLLLGLALATKWVALYAIGLLGLLVLIRSALGRGLALLTMIGLTCYLGYLAIRPPPDTPDAQLNYFFLLLMVGLTLALAAGMALRPVRMTPDEARLVVLGPALAGLLAMALGVAATTAELPAEGPLTPERLIYVGAGLLLLAAGVYAALRLAGRQGYGPLAKSRRKRHVAGRSSPPPPRGWLRPGSGPLGLSWMLALGALICLPLAVYVVSYVPWVELGNRWWNGFPADHSGQTFLDLQVSMYDYHNYLRATHAASSPWWAWPLNLKPVWFEQQGYANDTTAVIYNTGNLVIFWLAIPAVAWVAYQAWRRRSLALTLLVLAIACLWLPWARIDRVAFQYHIFTVLPFSFLALAYFLAELWHGPSARTWRLARVAAALAILGPALLWLLRLPLCVVGRVESVNPGAEVCGMLDRQLVVTDLQLVGVLLIAAALLGVAALLWLGPAAPDWLHERRHAAYGLSAAGLLLGLVLLVVGALLPASPVFEAPLRLPELPALLVLLLLAGPAYYVLRARDPRRFVVGTLIAAGVWFVLWYPNVAGLPLPSRLAHLHLGLLPTWNYSYQFGANQDPANRAAPDLLPLLAIASVLVLLVLAVMYAALGWRAERAEASELRALHEAG